jgi:hypothetical protein
MPPLRKPLRLLLIAGAGVSTFYVAAQWSGAQRDSKTGLVEPVVRAAPRSVAPPTAVLAMATAPAASEPDAALSAGERSRSIPKSQGDPFTSLSWLPPPPPPAPPPPPPPPPRPPEPVAPPLPFVFVGMLERGGTAKPEAFLAKGDALFVVSAGDTLDNNTYRVDALSASEVVMTYLPLNTLQKLNLSTGSK